MKYPALRALPRIPKRFDRFYGLWHRENIREGAFYDAENLTADSFPLLSTRENRLELTRLTLGGEAIPFETDSPITAAAEIEGGFCWCTGTGVYVNGAAVQNCALDPEIGNRRILPFGRNLFVAPDGKYVLQHDTGAPTVVHAAFRRSAEASVSYGFLPGNPESFSYDVASPTEPAEPAEGTVWLRTNDTQPEVYYRGANGWIRSEKVYLILSAPGIGSEAVPGDAVFVGGLKDMAPQYTVSAAEPDRLFLAGPYVPLAAERLPVTVHKVMPVLDLTVEHGNRLWGCRYGPDRFGRFVNEIYASALGDPTVWDRFEGLSTDSYCVSLGCSGPFTGVCVLGGELVFFKENHMIRVSGGAPAEYTVTVIPARGAEQGAGNTCVNLNEQAFYKSRTGVMRYDGALPVNVSEALGAYRLSDCIAGAGDGKYYLAASVEGEGRRLFVFDAETGLWNKEDDPGIRFFVTLGGRLFFLCSEQPAAAVYRFLLANAAFAGTPPNPFGPLPLGGRVAWMALPPVSWFAETGELGPESATAIVRGLEFRLTLKPESVFRASILCGDGKKEIPLCRINPRGPETFTVPVNTPRCHSFRLRLAGEGACTLHAVTVIREKTGEVKRNGC